MEKCVEDKLKEKGVWGTGGGTGHTLIGVMGACE